MSALVQDSFTPCFEEPRKDPWNFNAYLFIFWIIGCVFRYAICLPFRLIVWMIGSAVYFIRYGILKLTVRDPKKRKKKEVYLFISFIKIERFFLFLLYFLLLFFYF